MLLFSAAVLIAFCGGWVAAFETEVREDQANAGLVKPGAEGGVSLFQSGKTLSTTLHKDDIWDGMGSLGKDDDLDVASVLLEDDASVDPAECHKAIEAEPHKEDKVHTTMLPAGIVEHLALFQDVVWFGFAFAAFIIWRCFADMEKTAETLAKPKDHVPEKSAGQVAATTTPMQMDALVKAMYSDNKDDLRKLLDERSVNACDDVSCCTALHMAAHCNSLAAAEAILSRGADANVSDVWDETPLHFAARAGNSEVCALLLNNRASLNAINADGFTPLLVAATAKKVEVCELLLDKGAHTGGADEEDVPPLLNNLLMGRILRGGAQDTA